jgi:hypothetical protein
MSSLVTKDSLVAGAINDDIHSREVSFWMASGGYGHQDLH